MAIAKARENAAYNLPGSQADHLQYQPPDEGGHEGSACCELVPAAIPEHRQLIHRLIQFTASVLPVVPVFGAIDDLDHERVDMVGLFGDLTAQLLGNVSHDR